MVKLSIKNVPKTNIVIIAYSKLNEVYCSKVDQIHASHTLSYISVVTPNTRPFTEYCFTGRQGVEKKSKQSYKKYPKEIFVSSK